jgi:aspartate racemase
VSIQLPEREIFGVVGGLGPVASATFVQTIYEFSAGRQEQDAPFVILYSDPSYPDRTEALLNGDRQLLLDKLTQALEYLHFCRSKHIVICCVTIHDLLKSIPERWRSKVISLVDVVLWRAANSRHKYLLLCSNGTRRLRLFENSHLWQKAGKHLILPQAEDQKKIHQMIYELKQCPIALRHERQIERLLIKYRTDSYAVGCTEFHLVTKRLLRRKHTDLVVDYVDPLVLIAEALCRDQIEELAINIMRR